MPRASGHLLLITFSSRLSYTVSANITWSSLVHTFVHFLVCVHRVIHFFFTLVSTTNYGGWAKYISVVPGCQWPSNVTHGRVVGSVRAQDFPFGFPLLSTKILLDIRSSHQILLATMIILYTAQFIPPFRGLINPP